MSRASKKRKFAVQDFVEFMNGVAPVTLAQKWDNVGLLAGDQDAELKRALFCIDLMPGVVEEAVKRQADLIMAYHPPLFKPVSRLMKNTHTAEGAVFECIRNGIAVYSTHTALDAAKGGTNDVMAKLCNLQNITPLEFGTAPEDNECKVVVFVPENSLNTVATAMFQTGAGQIGDYSHCSFRAQGHGTFRGGDETSPAVGRKGRLESVQEARLEVVTPRRTLPAVTRAMIAAHPYEEPAFDIYERQPAPVDGIGRTGDLPKGTTLAQLARKLKRLTRAATVQVVGDKGADLTRAIIVVGAAGSLPFQVGIGTKDVIITGEIRHHDALRVLRCGGHAIALNHWTSEHPSLTDLAGRLTEQLPGIEAMISERDAEPFQPV